MDRAEAHGGGTRVLSLHRLLHLRESAVRSGCDAAVVLLDRLIATRTTRTATTPQATHATPVKPQIECCGPDTNRSV